MVTTSVENTLLTTTDENMPTFSAASLGNLPAEEQAPLVDVLATRNSTHAVLLLLHKGLDQPLGLELNFSGLPDGVGELELTTLTASNADTMSLNRDPCNYTFSSSGIVGSALHVAHVENAVLVPGHRVIDASAGSIELWIRPEYDGDDSLEHPILSFGATFQLIKVTQNAIVAAWSDDAGHVIITYSDCSSWKRGAWQHVAVTWNSSGNVSLYVNASLMMEQPMSSIHAFVDNREPVFIGTSIANFNVAGNISLDEVRISSVPRSPQLIAVDFQGGLQGQPLEADVWTTALLPLDGSIAVIVGPGLADCTSAGNVTLVTAEVQLSASPGNSSSAVVMLPPMSMTRVVVRC
jgi:hypothetical protein